MGYQAPVDDIMFALKTAGDLPGLLSRGLYPGLDEDTIRAVLEEAGRFASEVLDPLNKIGDRAHSRLVDGRVVTPRGWLEAYRGFADGGWSALPCPEEFGGQGLPEIVAMAACEIWNSANVSFGLCPLLTQGAIHALDADGSPELKARYLPKMVSGAWTGTMNLTEPQAGSDLSAVQTRAVRAGDGTYRITGTKIFITYGDHDLTENIVHLVLARIDGAPAGTRGISLFLVPKVLVNDDGSLGAANDVVCAGLEHKLGIHASPTAVMKFGERGGAVGYLVGRENQGLNTMFLMMNAARLAVGLQGVGVAERATQHAQAYAQERRQGRAAGSSPGQMAPIITHPDIRRTLMTMRALTRAARAICLVTAREIDVSLRGESDEERAAAANCVALLTPVAKAFATDIGCEVASMGIQIHGGMGFVEETGAAQFYRDARILPIYEGTNGIQAIDLVARKLPLGDGAVVATYLGTLEATAREVAALNHAELGRLGQLQARAVAALVEATRWMFDSLKARPDEALASATPYLRLFGIAAGGHYLARGALAALEEKTPAAADRIALARFFAEHVSVGAPALSETVTAGAAVALSPSLDAALA